MTPDRQVVKRAVVAGRPVAYSVTGSGHPLVMLGWWANHLMLDWDDPLFRAFVLRLAERRTVVRFDQPGTGLSGDAQGSDSAAAGAGGDAQCAVLAGLLAEVVASPASVLGVGQGAPVATRVAAAHPELVDHLVLWGGYARGSDLASNAMFDAISVVVGGHWEIGSRLMADLVLGQASAAEKDAYARRQRRAATRASALEAVHAARDIDAADALASVRVPTLVAHRRGDRVVPFVQGRELATGITGATFVPLEGAEHLPWHGDAEEAAQLTLGFLGVRTARAHRDATPVVHLSAREGEVLRLVAQGMTDLQIADELVLSAHTVHRHVANARVKLGVTSRAAAAAWAAQHGVI